MKTNKITKTVASITLGATLLFTSVSGASAATYTVKSGDTLSGIAKKYGTTYKEIMNKNGMKSTKLKIGQKLQVEGKTTSSSTSSKSTSTAVSGASAATTYTVKSGDTLSGIAKKFGTTYKEIMNINGMKSAKLKIGQKLQVGGKTTSSSTSSKSTSTAVSSTTVVNVAKKYLGVPYVFGGASPKGFDCSGLIYYAFKNSGKSISRKSAEGYYHMAKKVSAPQVGDLVFFSNTYKKGISHVGIYLGDGKMISASGTKVRIESVHSSYWKSHFTGYGRI